MERIRQIIAAMFLLALTGSVNAAQISGSITIGGTTEFYDNGSTSTGLNWDCGTCGAEVNTFPSPTGDFTSLAGLNTNTGDLQLYSFYYSDIPQQIIWEITYGGLIYSFTLQTVQVVSGDTTSDNFANLVLTGTGYFSITNDDATRSYAGFDDTYASWSFTNNILEIDGFVSTTTNVAEPGTIALLGLGLLGIGAAGRLRKSA